MLILLVHVLLLLAVLHGMPLFRQSGVRTVFWGLLLALKVAIGYALIAYYDLHYGGSDMRGYLNGSDTVYRICIENPIEGIRLFTGAALSEGTIDRMGEQVPMWFGRPYSSWFNDSRTVIRIQTLIRFVSEGNIWVHLIWTNMAALVGGVALIRFFRHNDQTDRIPAWSIGLLFIPNGLLWSSTILKEPFLLLALGLTLLTFRNWLESGFKHRAWPLLFALFLFLLIKPFWLMALVPGFMGWAAFRQKQNSVLAIVASYVLVLLLAMVVGLISSDYHLPSLLFGEQRNMWRFSVFGGAGSLIEPVGFAPTWLSLFKHVPETFVLTMIQPLPASWDDWESLFLFSENILFPVLVILMLLQRDVRFRLWSRPSLVLAICTGFIIVLVSGFTTPVAGTLVRYRWPGLLLLLMALSTAYFSRSSTDTKVDAGGSPD